MFNPLWSAPGGWELVLILAVIVLLFGARKLPEFARGTGQALRIFKAETKGLINDDDDDKKRDESPQARAEAEQPPGVEVRPVINEPVVSEERRDTHR